MPFTSIPTVIPEVVFEPKIFGDARGFFFESFNARDFRQLDRLDVDFVQDNHSKSGQGVLRGLHYQISSPTFGRWVGQTLSADDHRQMWIPPGFAHGFVVLSETAEFLYKTTDYWFPDHERSLLWNDPEVGYRMANRLRPATRRQGCGRQTAVGSRSVRLDPSRHSVCRATTGN